MFGRAGFLCWLFGHAEAHWHCREKGTGWQCPDCCRIVYSRVLPARREVLR